MSIVPTMIMIQFELDWWNMQKTVTREQYIANRAAEWALEQAIMICNENGHLDGHSCAEAIYDLLSGNDPETITGLHALSSLLKGGESDGQNLEAENAALLAVTEVRA
jgi:hypothetical protein